MAFFNRFYFDIVIPIMLKNVKIYWGRIIFALFLMPAAAGFTGVLIFCLKKFSFSYIPFLLGVLSYTLIYPIFKKPFLSYVIGHELTHVLGIWLARGKVHSVRVSKRGGMVKTDKANVWISLMPYFFPFYSFIVLAIYYILSILWNVGRFFGLMVFALGLTWAFHLWMTLHIVKQNQPDIKYSGVLFSAVIIFTINVIILILLLTIISPELTMQKFIGQSVKMVQGSYLWILQKLI